MSKQYIYNADTECFELREVFDSIKLTDDQFHELSQFWHEYMVLGPPRKDMGLDRAGIALNFSQWIDSDDEEPEYGLPEIIAFFDEKARREGTAPPESEAQDATS